MRDSIEAALIEEGLLPSTPADPGEWGPAIPDREAEAEYRRQVVERIVARIAAEAAQGAAPRAEGLDWGRLGYVLGLIGPVDIDDTEDAFVAYTEDIRERYLSSDLEDDPQYESYVARLSRPSDERLSSE